KQRLLQEQYTKLQQLSRGELPKNLLFSELKKTASESSLSAGGDGGKKPLITQAAAEDAIKSQSTETTTITAQDTEHIKTNGSNESAITNGQNSMPTIEQLASNTNESNASSRPIAASGNS